MDVDVDIGSVLRRRISVVVLCRLIPDRRCCQKSKVRCLAAVGNQAQIQIQIQIQPPEYKREIAAGWLVPVDKGSRSRGGLSLFSERGRGVDAGSGWLDATSLSFERLTGASERVMNTDLGRLPSPIDTLGKNIGAPEMGGEKREICCSPGQGLTSTISPPQGFQYKSEGSLKGSRGNAPASNTE